MTDQLPAPLTPADCDLQDFKFMPLDVARLRDSDLASDETPEACWAAVLLWSASWHQIPAASIPDNDQWIAKAAGYAQRGKISPDWEKVRAGALRGWIRCADGRMYHPVVAEKALIAWGKKQATGRKINRRLEIESAEWAAVRSAVFERDRYTCTYCKAVGVRLEADHVVPVSRGGATAMDNLATACLPCNRSKGTKLLSEWCQ